MSPKPPAPIHPPQPAQPPVPDDTVARAAWLGVLARAPRAMLQALSAPAFEGQSFTWLRAPEVGLAMLRGRIGNGGDRFNVGEATLTRCVVRLQSAGGGATAGVGYLLGRDPERAEWVAKLDALLQQAAHHRRLMADVVEPLAGAAAARQQRERERAAAGRVHFATLDTPPTADRDGAPA